MVLDSDGRVPGRTHTMGKSARIRIPDARIGTLMSFELPDPQRDEDEPTRGWNDPLPDPPKRLPRITGHDCEVLSWDTWMCSDCGKIFPRDATMGDYPESAIIEGNCEFPIEEGEWWEDVHGTTT